MPARAPRASRSRCSSTARRLSGANSSPNDSSTKSSCFVAEQCLGAAVGGKHATGAVEHQHAIGGGIEDRPEFVRFRGATKRPPARRFGFDAWVLIIRASAFSSFQTTPNSRPSTGFCLPLTVAMVSDLGAVLASLDGDRRFGLDEQAIEAACFAQRFQASDSRSTRGTRGWRRSEC